MAERDASIETVDVAEARRGTAAALDQFEAAAEVGKLRCLRVPPRLPGWDAVAPQEHRLLYPRQLGPRAQIHAKTCGDHDGIEHMVGLFGDHGHRARFRHHVEPRLGEVHCEARVPVAAQD